MRPAPTIHPLQLRLRRLHWRPYWALMQLAFQKQFAYRSANLAGFITNIFFAALRAAVIVARAQDPCRTHRRSVWPAQHVVVGFARHRIAGLVETYLRGAGRPLCSECG